LEKQGPEIKRIVEEQTKEAVKKLEPTIDAAVERTIQEQIKTALDPIRSQIAIYADNIRLGNLTTLARSDDREAFDYLVAVALGAKWESANPDLRKLASTTVSAVIHETQSPIRFTQTFKETQTPDAMKQFMFSPQVAERQAALDNYPPDDRSILPILMQLIDSDHNISVLYRAVHRFNNLTKKSFEFWQKKEITEWWEHNREAFQ
jgi:hypothetical protein